VGLYSDIVALQYVLISHDTVDGKQLNSDPFYDGLMTG